MTPRTRVELSSLIPALAAFLLTAALVVSAAVLLDVENAEYRRLLTEARSRP